jgi:hypothetical protein
MKSEYKLCKNIEIKINHQKSSGGATKLGGGSPVCGSVPTALLKRRMCGSGLWIS